MVAIGIKGIIQVSVLCGYKNIRYHYCSLFGQQSRWQNWVGYLCNTTNKFQPANSPWYFCLKYFVHAPRSEKAYTLMCPSTVWNSLLPSLLICSV